MGLFDQQGRRWRAGQFRPLAEREDEGSIILVRKGTIKRMDHQDQTNGAFGELSRTASPTT